MRMFVNDFRMSFVSVFMTLFFCVGCELSQPIGQPITQPISYPITQPIWNPITRPIWKPISQPIWKPIWQPIAGPISYPIDQSVSQPIVQPVSGPITQPIVQPVSGGSSGIFLLSGSAEQQAAIRKAISRCTFPFDRLRPGLQIDGLNSIRISWQSMDSGTLGWASTGGEIAINNTISGKKAQRTAIHELGHVVDFFYMTPQMREEITKLWHPDKADDHKWLGSPNYWDQNGEAFSELFLWAFADEELWFDSGYSHKPTKELAMKLRAILLPRVAMKLKP